MALEDAEEVLIEADEVPTYELVCEVCKLVDPPTTPA